MDTKLLGPSDSDASGFSASQLQLSDPKSPNRSHWIGPGDSDLGNARRGRDTVTSSSNYKEIQVPRLNFRVGTELASGLKFPNV
jgi:hypothetical protein